MPEASHPYVFLSYASVDRERALAIAGALERSGVQVWVDQTSIAGGTSWNAEIVRGIRDCAALLLLTTPDAVRSRNVQRELQLAVEFDRAVLPLRLEAAEYPAEMRYALAGVQWVDVLDRPAEAWQSDLLRALAVMGIAPAPPTDAAPGMPPGRTNLPAALTSFVGREAEIAEVRRLLEETRLLTLSGAGGVGKTRLAVEAAAGMIDAYPDGVWLAELAALVDPAALGAAVASALDIEAEPRRPLAETLLDVLRPRRMLLILDNCEHLIAAAAEFADRLLRACPDLRILATSREALGIAGEVTWLVPSLPLPGSGVADAETIIASEAVRLFVDRAAAASPGFRLTAENAAAVAEICRRLDGIPLALELAAARVRALSVDQLAGRLGDRFRLLTGGSRAALPRQQTLRAAIDWSYDLLDGRERVFLQRLSAFAGGWDLDAAEAVCAGDGIAAEDALDLLVSLVEKSLAQAEDAADGARRYRMLETVRQYAREKLLDAGGAAAVRARHRDWYLRLAEAAEPHLETAAQWHWTARLEREQENLRAALEWSLAAHEREPALRLAAALGRYWLTIGRIGEGMGWLEKALALDGAVAPAVRARGLLWLGQMGALTGETRPEALEEAIALFRQLDEPGNLSHALTVLGGMATHAGDVARAEAAYTEAVALARRADDPFALGHVLHWFGHLRERHDDWARAAPMFEESLACYRNLGDSPVVLLLLADVALSAQKCGDTHAALEREVEARALLETIGDRGPVAQVLLRLAEVAHLRGDTARAIELLERSVSLARERGGHLSAAGALAQLAASLLTLGEIDRAAGALAEALALQQSLPQAFQVAEVLALAAALAARRGNADRAARLIGAAHAQRERFALVASPRFAESAADVDGAARAALGEAAFAAASAEGRALSLDDAVALALEQTVEA